jgi:hypothetical protein
MLNERRSPREPGTRVAPLKLELVIGRNVCRCALEMGVDREM